MRVLKDAFKKYAILMILFLAFLFLDINANAAEEFEDADVIRIAGNIYRITFPYSLRTNIGMSIGSDGILLVDTGFKETAQALNKLMLKLGDGKVDYIINTHSHSDHVGGNRICGKNATIVEHENLAQCMSYGFIFPGNSNLKGKLGVISSTYFSLNYNDERIQIIPCTGIHSHTDLLVYFSKSGVVHMGDLLLTQSFPAVGSNVKEYVAFIGKLGDIFPPGTKYIAGHGRDCTINEVEEYRQMLLTTIGIVQNEMKAGKNLAQIQKAEILKKWESWGEFLTFLNPGTWIESIYKSYL